MTVQHAICRVLVIKHTSNNFSWHFNLHCFPYLISISCVWIFICWYMIYDHCWFLAFKGNFLWNLFSLYWGTLLSPHLCLNFISLVLSLSMSNAQVFLSHNCPKIKKNYSKSLESTHKPNSTVPIFSKSKKSMQT